MGARFTQPFFVTPHAVTRFRQRLTPGAPAAQVIWLLQAALQGRMVYPPRRALAVADRARTFMALIQPGTPTQPWPQVTTVYRWRDYFYREDGRPRRRSVAHGFR